MIWIEHVLAVCCSAQWQFVQAWGGDVGAISDRLRDESEVGSPRYRSNAGPHADRNEQRP
jgi:hypothetical protein